MGSKSGSKPPLAMVPVDKAPAVHYHQTADISRHQTTGGSCAGMGKRCEPRQAAEVPVRIFGTDRRGRIFSEIATVENLSQHGAKLNGVKAKLRVDEVVGISYRRNKVHFQVKWAGGPGTPAEGQVGLLNLHPEKPFWNATLPPREIDSFKSTAANERRKAVRVKCSISVELYLVGQAVLWGHASDLSQGGCFVEMAIPLQAGSKFEIVLWLGANKLRLQGETANSSPGFGMGVRFTDATSQDHEFLQEHIHTLA